MGHRALHPILHYLRRLSAGPALATDLDDAYLLHRFLRHGDQAAFTAIVRRYGALVWGVCARRLGETPEAEDAFQATFLVLVRKAPRLRGPRPLGPWLYGVARRTALKAHGRAARRQARERALPAQVGGGPAGEAGAGQVWGELRPVLDEELARLPEKYRRPVLLCYLQGLSSEEAARALGCAKGTVFSRLSRARDLLRRRLSRRGLGVSGAALATVLTAQAAAQAAPAALVETAVGVGVLSAAGGAGPGVPAPLAALVEGVLRDMFLRSIKLGAVVLLVGVALSGAGLLAHRAFAGAPVAAADDNRGKDEPAAVVFVDPAPDVPAGDRAKTEQVNGGTPAPAPPAKLDLAQRLRGCRNLLTAPVRFGGFDDPETKFDDVLQYLHRAYNISFEVNDKAFRAEGVDFRERKIGKPIQKMFDTNLPTLLGIILARVSAPSGVVYVLRPDRPEIAIEITTTAALRKELGIPERRPLLPLICDAFEATPIDQALGRVADYSGLSVVIDPRVADKTKTKTDAQLRNVPTDTAVRLLADMAGLGVVQMDNVFYVTARENAATLQTEQAKLDAAQPPAKPTEKPSRSPAKPAK
jgi:RNA polymerase sigma factor (sigma-70 family)